MEVKKVSFVLHKSNILTNKSHYLFSFYLIATNFVNTISSCLKHISNDLLCMLYIDLWFHLYLSITLSQHLSFFTFSENIEYYSYYSIPSWFVNQQNWFIYFIVWIICHLKVIILCVYYNCTYIHTIRNFYVKSNCNKCHLLTWTLIVSHGYSSRRSMVLVVLHRIVIYVAE